MVDSTQLGDRLRTARKRSGLSQRAVADALGLPRTAVTDMEGGRRAVSTLELARLAATLGRSAASFLGEGEGPEAEDLSVALHQALPEMEHAPEARAALRRLLGLCREGAGLRRLLDQTAGRAVPCHAARTAGVDDAIRQGEAGARDERRRLRLGDAPIPDVGGLVSEQGIWTAAAELPDSVSGLFVNHPDAGLAVLVNRGHRLVLRRLSCSRGYAHALFDDGETVTAARAEDPPGLRETRAIAFATAFLMPAGGVAGRLERLHKGHPGRGAAAALDGADGPTARAGIRAIAPTDVALLAHSFGVSLEAMVWRLRSLDHIGDKEAAALIGQEDLCNRYLELADLRKPLEGGVPPGRGERELRSRLIHLAVEAFRREEISRGRLIEIGRELSTKGDELIELAEATRPG